MTCFTSFLPLLVELQIPHIGLASNNIAYFIQFKNLKFAHSLKLCHMKRRFFPIKKQLSSGILVNFFRQILQICCKISGTIFELQIEA